MWLEECARLFSPLPAYLIGIKCPLNILIQRENERKDRTLGQAAAQFPLLHKHGFYDLEVDTSIFTVEECAHLIKDRVERGDPPHAFEHLWQKFSH